MTDTDSGNSPLTSVAGTVGPHVTEAFALLGDETQLSILLALWEEYEPYAGDTITFSQLFDRVGYDDRGNFNYHLQNLVGQFVRKHPETGGYELTDPGMKLVQTVVAGIEAGDETFAPAEIDQTCPLCGAPTTVGYRERNVFWKCTGCRGIVPEGSALDGFLGSVKLEPAGVAERTPEEVKAASRLAIHRREGSFFDGLCPTCSETVDGRLEACRDHDPDPICDTCNRRFSTRAYFECRICKDHISTSAMRLALGHPAVTMFYETRGVSTRFTAEDFEHGIEIESLLDDFSMEVLSVEPPRVEVSATMTGDEVRLTFDETVSVVDVTRPAPPDR